MNFNKYKLSVSIGVIFLLVTGLSASYANASLMPPDVYSISGKVDEINYQRGFIKMGNKIYHFNRTTGTFLKDNNISNLNNIDLIYTTDEAKRNIIIDIKLPEPIKKSH